jgi:5S rRNA maturation endonuclease (ribonuclease M5)
MSAYFPDVNLEALSHFAATTAAVEHLKENANTRPVTPHVIALTDIDWAGEKVRRVVTASLNSNTDARVDDTDFVRPLIGAVGSTLNDGLFPQR